MKKTGVLFMVNSLRFGGAEKHVVTLLNQLDSDAYRLALTYLKPDEDLLPQIKIERLEACFYAGVRKKFDLTAVRRLAAFIDMAEIDVIFCVNTYSMLYGLLAGFLSKRRPNIIEGYHTTLLREFNEKLKMIFYRPLFGWVDMLVYVCENQRQYWHAKGLRSPADTVIYNGIDIDYFSDHYSAEVKQKLRQNYGFADSDYVIGICAGLRPEKAHADLLEAVAMLRKSGLAAKCFLIGEGIERPSIEAKIVELGLEQHVVITGFQADVRLFIAVCDVITLVSRSETFSIAALEAMAMGKPLVISRIGGAEEQVQSGVNGYVFDAGNIPELCHSLEKLADNGLRETMSVQARNIVCAKFSMKPMIQAYEKLLNSFVKKHE